MNPKTILLLEEASDTDSKDCEPLAFIMKGMEPGDSEVTFSDGRQTTMAENIEAVINDYEVEWKLSSLTPLRRKVINDENSH